MYQSRTGRQREGGIGRARQQRLPDISVYTAGRAADRCRFDLHDHYDHLGYLDYPAREALRRHEGPLAVGLRSRADLGKRHYHQCAIRELGWNDTITSANGNLSPHRLSISPAAPKP